MTEPAAEEDLPEDVVADYLRRHPDFFVHNPQVLDGMAPPQRWSGDGVVDLQRTMVERHRAELGTLMDAAEEVLETSRANMTIQARTHEAALTMLGAGSADGLIRVVAEDLPMLLDVDVVALSFERIDGPVTTFMPRGSASLPAGSVDDLVGRGRDVVIVPSIADDGTLFGEARLLVRSAALARLRPGAGVPAGLFALGARNEAFQAGQGTELLGFLARVMENCVHRWLGTAN